MPYPSSPPARLRLVAFGLHGLRSLLEELVPQFRAQAEILIVDKAYGEAVEAVQVLRQTGEIDVLVSAGSNGSYLREHLDLPVVLVHPGGLTLWAVWPRHRPSVRPW
jgi:propionate catabolism operon transcriptional regulator